MMAKDTQALQDAVKEASAQIMGSAVGRQNLPDWLDNTSLKVKRGGIIIDADYKAKQSILWQNLIWRIGRDIISRTTANHLFAVFEKSMPNGGDLQEQHIRLKNAIDRTTLANSALFTNYPDDIDVAWHRLNVQEVIPTTYREAEIQKITASWEVLTSEIAAITDNLDQSYNAIITRKVKQMLYDGYATGQIVRAEYAQDMGKEERLASLLSHWDEMQLEPAPDYVGYNQSENAKGVIANRSQSVPYLIIEASYCREIDVYNSLALHFGKQPNTSADINDLFKRIIKVRDFPQKVQDETTPEGSKYKPPEKLGKLRAMLVDEDFIHFYKQLDLRVSWRNELTLNVLVAKHYDILLSYSPFKNALALVDM